MQVIYSRKSLPFLSPIHISHSYITVVLQLVAGGGLEPPTSTKSKWQATSANNPRYFKVTANLKTNPS